MHAENGTTNPGTVTIVTGEQRPDLLAQTIEDDCPLIYLWPEFFDGEESSQRYFPALYEIPALAKFQLLAVHTLDGKETVVGQGNSIPFYWRELAEIENDCKSPHFGSVLRTLPDGGFDTMIARGVNQASVRGGKKVTWGALTHDQLLDMKTWTQKNAPNAMSALSIAVLPPWRGHNVADMLIKKMKETARREKLAILVVPLRPTKKTLFQNVDMAVYAGWTQDANGTIEQGKEVAVVTVAEGTPGDGDGKMANHETNETMSENQKANGDTNCELTLNTKKTKEENDRAPHFVPFDPWLRKHVRLGAQIIKVAPVSMIFKGTGRQWQEWTGIDVRQRVEEKLKQRESVWVLDEKDTPITFELQGCLAPMTYRLGQDVGEYTEPNLWLFHSLD